LTGLPLAPTCASAASALGAMLEAAMVATAARRTRGIEAGL
jgi:hypothetical protein